MNAKSENIIIAIISNTFVKHVKFIRNVEYNP